MPRRKSWRESGTGSGWVGGHGGMGVDLLMKLMGWAGIGGCKNGELFLEYHVAFSKKTP